MTAFRCAARGSACWAFSIALLRTVASASINARSAILDIEQRPPRGEHAKRAPLSNDECQKRSHDRRAKHQLSEELRCRDGNHEQQQEPRRPATESVSKPERGGERRDRCDDEPCSE